MTVMISKNNMANLNSGSLFVCQSSLAGDRNGQAIAAFRSWELQVLQTSVTCQWIALDE